MAAGAVVLVAVGTRSCVSGCGALERGREALERGEEVVGAFELREAVSWYLPIAPWRWEAAELLWGLHERQANDGRLPEAVRTLNLLRAGLFAGRSFFGPDGEWRERIDAALAPLMARWERDAAVAEGRAPPGPLERRTERFQAVLERDPMPNRWLGLLAVLGFGLWGGAAWWSAERSGRQRVWGLGMAAGGFLLFLLGLGFA